jgi:hypothetical protein
MNVTSRYRGRERRRIRFRSRFRARHPSADIVAAAQLLLPHLERGQRIDAVRALRARWKPPSAAPTPPAPGTGRPPTRPARRRPCCSCASSESRFSARAGSPLRACRCSARSRRWCRPTRAAPRRAQALPAVLDADPARPGRAPPRPRSRPADRVLEPSAGTGLLAILAEIAGQHARPQRAGRDPRLACSGSSFRPCPSRASTRPRSTITSTMPSSDRRADEPAVLGHGACRGTHRGRRLPPCRLGAGAPRSRRPASWRSPAPTSRPTATMVFGLCPSAGTRPRRVHRRRRRARLCQARHDVPTRLTVIDKQCRPTIRPSFPAAPGIAPDAATLLGWVTEHVPARLPVDPARRCSGRRPSRPGTVRAYLARAAKAAPL